MKRFLLIATMALLTACGGGGNADTEAAPQTSSFLASEVRMAQLAFTPATQDELYQFFAVAFGAAPGVTYMGQLNDAANAGMTTKQIVNIFTTKSQFTDVYPTTLSNIDFAVKLVNNVVGASATSTAKAQAVADVVSALAAPGWTRGDVIFAIFTNLAGKSSTDPDWAGTSQQMKNQVIYARYYTEVMMGDTTDLPTLQNVISRVTGSSDTTIAGIRAALVNISNAGFARHVTTRTSVILNGSASSIVNNNSPQYHWLLTNRPTGSAAVLIGATTATPTFTADKAGNYIASLIVSDGTNSSTPSTVSITATGGRIALTQYRALAIKSDGTVLAWGSNLNGELGDGTRTERLYPITVTGLSGVIAISAGSFHSVALKSDGTVMTWGTGMLGNGIQTSSLVPQPVAGLTSVVAIAAGNMTTVALKADGTVVAWGNNYSGKLGDGTTTNRLRPVSVPGLTGVVAIASGVTYTVALKSDGTVFAWGDNTYGQLGDGTTTSHTSPSLVPGLTGVVAISAYRQTAAVKADGTVWMWGNNTNGQLGDGTTFNRLSPTVVTGLTGVVSIATQETNTVALKSNGTVMAWGHWLGLGDGSGQNQYRPVATLALTEVAAVAAGNMCTMVLNSDGTVWFWGMNNGEFGDGTNHNYSTMPSKTSLVL